MRMIIWFAAASLLAVAGSSRAQDNKSDPRFFLDVFDKLYGLQTKSIIVKDVVKKPTGIQTTEDRSAAKTRITITLAFTRNVRDVKDFPELQLLHDTFTVSTGVPYRFDNLPLIFHFFDEDNVCIDKIIISAIEGDVSGIKGEAFRIVLNCRTEIVARTKRIEARYYPPLR
jgi:hypothetical protein